MTSKTNQNIFSDLLKLVGSYKVNRSLLKISLITLFTSLALFTDAQAMQRRPLSDDVLFEQLHPQALVPFRGSGHYSDGIPAGRGQSQRYIVPPMADTRLAPQLANMRLSPPLPVLGLNTHSTRNARAAQFVSSSVAVGTF